MIEDAPGRQMPIGPHPAPAEWSESLLEQAYWAACLEHLPASARIYKIIKEPGRKGTRYIPEISCRTIDARGQPHFPGEMAPMKTMLKEAGWLHTDEAVHIDLELLPKDKLGVHARGIDFRALIRSRDKGPLLQVFTWGHNPPSRYWWFPPGLREEMVAARIKGAHKYAEGQVRLHSQNPGHSQRRW